MLSLCKLQCDVLGFGDDSVLSCDVESSSAEYNPTHVNITWSMTIDFFLIHLPVILESAIAEARCAVSTFHAMRIVPVTLELSKLAEASGDAFWKSYDTCKLGTSYVSWAVSGLFNGMLVPIGHTISEVIKYLQPPILHLLQGLCSSVIRPVMNRTATAFYNLLLCRMVSFARSSFDGFLVVSSICLVLVVLAMNALRNCRLLIWVAAACWPR